jgi:hypothetical protein
MARSTAIAVLAFVQGACGRVGFDAFATVEAVEPTYQQAAGWNDYVRMEAAGAPTYLQPGTPCDGTEPLLATSCTHAGVQRRALLRGVATCAGVTGTDTLDALQWRCDDSSGEAVLYATGLRAGAGLADLVDSSGWRPSQLLVTLPGGKTVSTTPATWWTDPVVPLASGTAIDQPGAVYVLAQSLAASGYNIAADHVAIVALPGATLSYGSGPLNCNDSTGLPAGATQRCLVSAGGRQFLWLEGSYDAASAAAYGVLLANSKFSQLHHVAVASAQQTAVLVLGGGAHRIIDLYVAHSALYGLSLFGADGNVARGIAAFDDGVSNTIGDCGIILAGAATDNVLAQVIAANDFDYGVLAYSGAMRNTYSHLTLANNPTAGIDIQGGGASTVVQVLALANQTNIRIDSNANVAAQLAASDGSIGLCSPGASAVQFNVWFGHHVLDDCRVGSVCDVTIACPSFTGGPIYTPGFDGASVLRDEVTTDDVVNPSDTSGQATASMITDWVHFESPLRGWGVSGPPFPDPADAGTCAGTCRIWDWRIRPGSAPLVRSADGSQDTTAVTAGAACPPAADGGFAITDASGNTFLVNALEILGDGIGDDDGLCESNEACVYSSYFGADQGWDVSYGASTCVFHDGTVTGVELHGPS